MKAKETRINNAIENQNDDSQPGLPLEVMTEQLQGNLNLDEDYEDEDDDSEDDEEVLSPHDDEDDRNQILNEFQNRIG